MEIIDLLSGFDLDHLKDKDLQNLAKGLAVTFIEKPLNTFDGTVPDESSESQMMTAVSAAFIKYMKKALEGGVFDKISMVASVTKNIAAGKSLRDCSDTPLDPSGFVKLVEAKHLHALSENDYHEIAQSQEARGVALGKDVKFFERIKNAAKIILPLVLTSLSRIDQISNSMQLRSFGKHKKRSWYMKKKMETADYAVIALCILIFVVGLYITNLGGNNLYNPFVR